MYAVIAKRDVTEKLSIESLKEKFLFSCNWFLCGWALHYFPFYLMRRVLYFHHYFPAMLYSSMLSGILIDHILYRLDWYFKCPVYKVSFMGIIFAIFFSFYLFCPLSYGMHGPMSDNINSTMASLKWMESWEI
ncbi:protein O-mannosyl-transferase 2-like [Saccoglossus kowalevskii]|uniref:Protein O-mannosyl-transferase 2-like n=1 Tax=Saccoglossus kowalevskii TaxID=10224 RepID=A0ABM0N1I2_SACKO|nr:PREDICTED: protein O-mannosyl-transferase 2-like [Saccoglossus kowalevskii]